MNEKYIVAMTATLAAVLMFAAGALAAIELAALSTPLVLIALWLGLRLPRNTVALDILGNTLRITENGMFGFRRRIAEIPRASVTGLYVARTGQQSVLRAVFLSLLDRNIGLCLDRSDNRPLLLARYVNESSPVYRRSKAALEEFFWPEAYP